MSEHEGGLCAEKGLRRRRQRPSWISRRTWYSPRFQWCYWRARKREARLVERPCVEGNCVELIDPKTGENTGGWGPVGCPCQDADTSVTPPAEKGQADA